MNKQSINHVLNLIDDLKKVIKQEMENINKEETLGEYTKFHIKRINDILRDIPTPYSNSGVGTFLPVSTNNKLYWIIASLFEINYLSGGQYENVKRLLNLTPQDTIRKL